MLKYIRENGPFLGVVGFSVGASMAFSLISLAERADETLLSKLGVKEDVSLFKCPNHTLFLV